jgi:hypothetical protein
MSDAERLARCEWEISQALAASEGATTPAERIGILLWEMDWRAEREAILGGTGGDWELAKKMNNTRLLGEILVDDAAHHRVTSTP